MKVSTWDSQETSWRNAARSQVQLTQAELSALCKGGVGVYRLKGVEVVVTPVPELGELHHKEIDS